MKWPACCQRTLWLRIGPFRTRNRAGARQIEKFARCSFAKTTANCFHFFCHFHLISSVSWPQRPLIMIAFIPSLPLPPRQHFCENFFRCPFHSKSAPRNRCPPPTFLCFLRPCGQPKTCWDQFKIDHLEWCFRIDPRFIFLAGLFD